MAPKGKDKKKEKEKPKKSKKKLIIILLILIILIGAGAGAFFFFTKDKEKFVPLKSQYFDITTKTEKFIYNHTREIHRELKFIDNEILVLSKETERVLGIEQEYPDQKKITDKAVARFDKLKKATIKEIKKIIVKYDSLYVSYAVNPDSGKEIIKQEAPKLKETINQIKNKLKIETDSIKKNTPETKGFIKKITGKFLD